MTDGDDRAGRRSGRQPGETPDPTTPTKRDHPAARAYPWERLPSFGSEHVEATNRLSRLLARRPSEVGALSEAAETLASETGLDHHLRYRGLRLRDDLRDTLGFGDAFLTRVRLPPGPDVGAVAIDMSLADRWLSALLDAPPESRRLGEAGQREFGLVTFVLLSVLDTLKRAGLPPIVLSSEPPLREVLVEELRSSEYVVEVDFVVACDERDHRVRLFFPVGLVRRLGAAPATRNRRFERERFLESPFADLHVELPATIGRTVLDASAYSGLNAGDVVLFDEEGWREGSEAARLYLGRYSLRRFLPAGVDANAAGDWHIEIADKRPRMRTEGPMSEDTSAEGAASPQEASPKDDDGVAPTELLESPEVTLEARIGSARITVRELHALEAGQILDLDRAVGDAADLVVDGKQIGEGELVEIDGRLGVRIREIER